MSSMKAAAFFAGVILVSLQIQADAETCRRPRPLRRGRYVYRDMDDIGARRLPSGYVVRVVCEAQTELRGNEFIVCGNDGSWSDATYCARPEVCPGSPAAPANGYVRVRTRFAGGRAIYRCNHGYQLYGRSFTTCQENTLWSMDETPSCFPPPSCPAPTDLAANLTASLDPHTGALAGELYTDGAVLGLECPVGYVVSWKANMTCRAGAWLAAGETPHCIQVLCPPPTLEVIPHGNSSAEDRDYRVGEIIEYDCAPGYLPDGKTWQVCQESGGSVGVWSDRVPICEVATCANPGSQHLDNGRLSFTPPVLPGSSGEFTQLGRWPVGTVMSLVCSWPFELLGSSQRVCQPDGHWNGTLTACHNEEYFCSALGNPIHGSKIRPFTYDINSWVQFRCDPGYEMLGSAQMKCTIAGEWIGEMPRCLRRNEFDEFTRVTSGVGKTFDKLAIDGGFWATHHDEHNHNDMASRRKRAIDLNSAVGLDVYIAFDSSRSIGEGNFEMGKDFAIGLVNKLVVNDQPGGARVGVVVYSTRAQTIFHVDAYSDNAAVVAAIEDEVNYLGQGTSLPAALLNIKEIMLPHASNTNRANNKRVLLILTDGMNNMGGEPVIIAQELKEVYGFAIHCIGVSPDVSKPALEAVSSLPHSEHVFYLRNYREVEHAVNDITQTNRSYDACGVSGRSSLLGGASGRAVGGFDVEPGTWPWQAALYKKDGENDPIFKCGASLIDREWVLSAAHCFNEMAGDDVIVYLGLTDRNRDINSARAQRFLVTNLHLHPDFNQNNLRNDIALLKLDRPADLGPYVRTICLPPSEDDQPVKARRYLKAERLAWVTGWGDTRRLDPGVERAIVPSAILQEIQIPIKHDVTCHEKMNKALHANGHRVDVDAESQFCAGYINGTVDACHGDSGGPIFVKHLNRDKDNYVQIGIVSFGNGCAHEDFYGVYSRLTKLVNWVKGITAN